MDATTHARRSLIVASYEIDERKGDLLTSYSQPNRDYHVSASVTPLEYVVAGISQRFE